MYSTGRGYILIILLLFTANSELFGQFLINVSTDKKIYQINSPLNIKVSIINFSSKAHTVNFKSTCIASYEIVGKYNQLTEQTCSDTSVSFVMMPVNANNANGKTWDFRYNRPLPAGYYHIVGDVNGYGKSDTIEIKIVDTLSTRYKAFYEGNLIDSSFGYPISNVLIWAEGADTTYSDSYGRFLLEFPEPAFADSQTLHPLVKFSAPFYEDYSERISISKGDSISNQIVKLKSSPLPFISGHVDHDSSDVSSGLIIYFYGLNNNRLFYTGLDYAGNYSTQLIPDSYYILGAISYNAYLPGGGGEPIYDDLYYENKSKLSGANIFKFSGDTSGIDFSIPAIQKGTISGTIRDALTQLPISNAFITVATVRSDSGFFSADKNGNYSIQVYKENYILKAEKENYFPQFYKNAHHAYNAIPVVVDSNNLNITGINFNLIPEQIAQNTIVGYVKNSTTGKALPDVQTYAIPDSGGLWAESKSDTNGRYEFSQVVDGKYILLFGKDGYISKYYNSSFRWEDASVLDEFNGSSHTTLNDVSLIPTGMAGGNISGKILTGTDSVLNYSLVYAIDSSDSVVSTSISKDDGSYIIQSLPEGYYTIKAGKVGYSTTPYPEKINIDLKNRPSVSNVNIVISVTGIEAKINTMPASNKLFQNYPNPFNPVTTIRYELLKGSNVRLDIYNILGEKISELINTYQKPGIYKVDWNAKNFASGVYLYTIEAGEFRDSKKLILLK